MPTLYPFRCSNGHSFEANAKLRTRCPECGISTKRSFTPSLPTPTPSPESKPSEEPTGEPPNKDRAREHSSEPPAKGPVLVRQGKPRTMPAKKSPPKAPPKTVAKKKPNPPIGSKTSVAAGLVAKKRVTTPGVHPAVRRAPPKTAVARGSHAANQREHHTPYWHKVAEKYGI